MISPTEEFPHLARVVETRAEVRGAEITSRENLRLLAELERRGLPKGPVPPRRFRALLGVPRGK